MTWTRVCSTDDLAPGDILRVERDVPVAIINLGGEFHAVNDTCTHAEASLADGWVDSDAVVCPFHLARFCVKTGRVESLPATEPLPTHETMVEDGSVFVWF